LGKGFLGRKILSKKVSNLLFGEIKKKRRCAKLTKLYKSMMLPSLGAAALFVVGAILTAYTGNFLYWLIGLVLVFAYPALILWMLWTCKETREK